MGHVGTHRSIVHRVIWVISDLQSAGPCTVLSFKELRANYAAIVMFHYTLLAKFNSPVMCSLNYSISWHSFAEISAIFQE